MELPISHTSSSQDTAHTWFVTEQWRDLTTYVVSIWGPRSSSRVRIRLGSLLVRAGLWVAGCSSTSIVIKRRDD